MDITINKPKIIVQYKVSLKSFIQKVRLINAANAKNSDLIVNIVNSNQSVLLKSISNNMFLHLCAKNNLEESFNFNKTIKVYLVDILNLMRNIKGQDEITISLIKQDNFTILSMGTPDDLMQFSGIIADIDTLHNEVINKTNLSSITYNDSKKCANGMTFFKSNMNNNNKLTKKMFYLSTQDNCMTLKTFDLSNAMKMQLYGESNKHTQKQQIKSLLEIQAIKSLIEFIKKSKKFILFFNKQNIICYNSENNDYMAIKCIADNNIIQMHNMINFYNDDNSFSKTKDPQTLKKVNLITDDSISFMESNNEPVIKTIINSKSIKVKYIEVK